MTGDADRGLPWDDLAGLARDWLRASERALKSGAWVPAPDEQRIAGEIALILRATIPAPAKRPAYADGEQLWGRLARAGAWAPAIRLGMAAGGWGPAPDLSAAVPAARHSEAGLEALLRGVYPAAAQVEEWARLGPHATRAGTGNRLDQAVELFVGLAGGLDVVLAAIATGDTAS